MSTLSAADIATITAKCVADGVLATAIPDIIVMAEHGDFIAASTDEWLKEQKQPGARPHLWPMAGQVELEASAFGGNFTARNRLVKQIGIEAADARAKEWGLDGIHDYKTKPTQPGAQREKAKSSNPWSVEGWNLTKQMAAHRSDPLLAERLATAAHSHVGAAHPTKVA
jgi:hypothetical protein